MENGFITPVRNLDGSLSFVMLVGQGFDDCPRVRVALHMMSLYYGGMGRRLAYASGSPGKPRLTPRQREIITLLCAGYRQSDVAGRLGLSDRTVETHLAHARRNLNSASTPQLCVEAVRLGLVLP